MIIKIGNLSEGVHNYNFNEPVSAIGLEEPFYGNFQLKVELQKFHNQILIDAEITLQVKLECDRCTVNYSSTLKNQYKMVYFFGNEPEENSSINITYLALDADKIDLRADLRDYAILAIPMKKLCKTECKGLCPRCGKDLNVEKCNCEKEIDRRWLPLIELKNKLNIN